MNDDGPGRGASPPAGIVLAGGRSRRFGRDKLRADYDGQPLLWRPLRALAAAGCPEIVTVIGPVAPVPAIPPELGSIVRFARDPEPFAGPLVGLHAGLSATGATYVLVVAGDQPALRPELLVALAQAIAVPDGAPTAAAAVLVDPLGMTRPLPCVLDRAQALEAAAGLLAAGERRLRALIASLDARTILEAIWRPLDPDAGWTVDVDLPGDADRGP
jgi:molybdenum cofactor guanylyltransferase